MSTGFVTIVLDGVPVRLREAHDFGFLSDLGRVFRVFDEQDSGHVCFGVETPTEKLFVKYAGAKTIAGNYQPPDAIRLLKEALPAYEALRHPDVVELRDHRPMGDGYAAIYTWFPGEVLRPPDRRPDAPICRHRRLPLSRRLDTLDTIFAFHQFVVERGYVAIDFYDGAIMYDFSQHVTKICDIDCYRPRPYTNSRGRLPGSTRFMSPEEFELGAAIDEVTNVFTMGATAFVLLGADRDRSSETWEASPALYAVARRAIEPERAQRYASIAAFRRAWGEARCESANGGQ